MAYIKIDQQALRLDINQLKKCISDFQSHKAKLLNLINEISAMWVGNASEAFITQLKTEVDKTTEIVHVLTKYCEYIQSVIDKFDMLEKETSNRIKSSF